MQGYIDSSSQIVDEDTTVTWPKCININGTLWLLLTNVHIETNIHGV